ncbi:MAG: sugar ABC transporter permease [Oligoflexales bacterium]|nr:sugar ABC transporter permease [Oligoflexales bacterium]
MLEKTQTIEDQLFAVKNNNAAKKPASDSPQLFVRQNTLWQRLWKARTAYLFLAPAFIITAILVIYPLLNGVWFSLTDINQYNMGSTFQEPSYQFNFFENYQRAFFAQDTLLYSVLWQSIIFTFSSVFFHILFGLGLALLLNKKVRAKILFRTLLLIPWAVPSFVSAFAWRWLFNAEYGFFNLVLEKLGFSGIEWLSEPHWAMFSVILTNIWLGFPFMMVTFLGGLQSIPESLYEAAKVDGAGPWRRFFYITIPMLKPVAVTVTLLGIIWTFNLFHVIYLVTGGGPYGSTNILPTFTYFEAFQKWEFGMASAYGVIILSILIVFSSVYSRVVKLDH